MNAQPRIFRYAVPMPFSGLDLETLSLRWEASEKAPGEALNVGLKLRSLASVERWYGFSTEQGAEGLVLWATPFVFVPPGFGAEDAALDRAPVSAPALAAEPPPSLAIEGRAGMWIESPGGILAVSAGPLRLDYSPPPAGNRLVRLYLPPGILSGQVPGGGRGDFPIDINAGEGISSLIIKVAAEPPFPEPLEADPGVVLSYAQESWRDRRFEIFRWAGFPRILIFDFADYATQGRFFTRLAFFVEKTGYRGRLLRNEELQGLHGWNAHDYRAEDLAAFFGAAKERGFPLNPEERELESLLLKENILRRNPGGDLVPGEGAIISLSRESGLGLRRLFMVHEGFHGLFFIDEEFREFSRLRWENLESGAKRFILSYFDYQKYDIKDNYLVVNEFMSHILQQPVSQSARYFGETLAGRIAASSWRHTVLPPKDEESGTWPALARVFRAEAEAFSAYVNRRWGLAAGRVESLSLR
jgi:hypothetical protein